MPASVELTDETLTVHLQGADRLWALKTQLEIPLANVIGADRARDEAHMWLHGMRLGGTHIPGVISAGRFYSHGALVFWDVHEPDNAIAIELLDERYDMLVIEVSNPEQDIARVQEAIATAPTPVTAG
jgi:hypothetical protein